MWYREVVSQIENLIKADGCDWIVEACVRLQEVLEEVGSVMRRSLARSRAGLGQEV
ncbi:hypothetical protein MA16_Dca011932 [Dendrobium catenatum]|uniref:Uncharacterized protein n=1 Tax=Dendrobium catenatum TaxID=906689 RepID=A0A2I0WX05_9ASPA|nr:hypothetical protein MA16_Dca011932 [Dendrobium catenatum]